jgi:hypothetical protein
MLNVYVSLAAILFIIFKLDCILLPSIFPQTFYHAIPGETYLSVYLYNV